MKENITLVYNKSELGAGTRGSGLGVDALKITGISKESFLFKNVPYVTVSDKNDELHEPTNHKTAKYIDSIVDVCNEVCNKVYSVIKRNKFPFIISGDHASASGTVAGVKKAFPDFRVGVIWIDAHSDLHSPYTSPSGNVHGMSIATMINEDNLKFNQGNVEKETQEQWEKLKRVGGISPKVLAKDVVFVGVRDIQKAESHLMDTYGMINFTPENLRTKGIRKVVSEIKKDIMGDCDVVYVSFDVDSLDCDKVSYGTGTPVKNGLFEEEIKELLKSLMQWDKTVALEVTEINPLLDNKGNRMAEVALEILEYALG